MRLNLEMITRDPLTIPCLTDDYWATLDRVPGRDLARMLALVKKHARRSRCRGRAPLSADDQRAAEDQNVRRCLAYGRDKLGA